jgi:hypothetical protein
METIQIQISTELAQRLRPYQDDLPRILEWGLRYLAEKDLSKLDLEELVNQERTIAVLRQAGIAGPDLNTMTNYLAEPDNQNWQSIPASGQPASEIIIAERNRL